MPDPERRRGRTHDAERAKETILNAAEEVFAEQGFDGARTDAIAATAGYNKSLIFHYFDDKLGLYAAVLKRSERHGNEQQVAMLASLVDETTTHDAHKFRAFLEAMLRWVFDFLIANPRLLRILAWEEADGWQTFTKIIGQFDITDEYQIQDILRQAQRAGIMRPDLDPTIVYNLIVLLCSSYLTYIPRFQIVSKDEDLTSSRALEHARETIVKFAVYGIMIDLSEAKQ
ncbi:MAG: TetR family transcriptional regulator [Ktedonobacteraceae bacterium]